MRYSIFSVQDHYPDRGRSLATFYGELMDQCQLAEALGYDTFWIAEHHFHQYGVVPDPSVMLSALAQRTSRIRLGTAISTLTFHNPLHIAESYAMVDVLSGGRLTLGVGSGYLRHEFEGFGVDGATKRERFDETLALVQRLLAGERVSHRGRFHTLDQVAVNVRPLQQPAPPVYLAILRAEAAYHVGRQGMRMMSVPYASFDTVEQLPAMIAEYARGRAESGTRFADDDVALAFHCHVADSDREAEDAAAEAFELYVETRLYARRQSYADVIRSGLALFGSVETVTDKLIRLRDMGAHHVMLLQNFGMLAPERVARSMRLFAESVMPLYRKRIGA